MIRIIFIGNISRDDNKKKPHLADIKTLLPTQRSCNIKSMLLLLYTFD